jgi:hypothetical protein
MDAAVKTEIALLAGLTAAELRDRYAAAFGEPTRCRNRTWLVRRIAWRLQAKAEGGLTERALKRAAELADDADLRRTPPKSVAAPAPDCVLPLRADVRLPPPGTVLTRKYRGGTVQVRVLPHGFEYAGAVYGSLSAVAKAVTGSHCNGFLFFHLNPKGGDE